jgi:hypothetical protein
MQVTALSHHHGLAELTDYDFFTRHFCPERVHQLWVYWLLAYSPSLASTNSFNTLLKIDI